MAQAVVANSPLWRYDNERAIENFHGSAMPKKGQNHGVPRDFLQQYLRYRFSFSGKGLSRF